MAERDHAALQAAYAAQRRRYDPGGYYDAWIRAQKAAQGGAALAATQPPPEHETAVSASQRADTGHQESEA